MPVHMYAPGQRTVTLSGAIPLGGIERGTERGAQPGPRWVWRAAVASALLALAVVVAVAVLVVARRLFEIALGVDFVFVQSLLNLLHQPLSSQNVKLWHAAPMSSHDFSHAGTSA